MSISTCSNCRRNVSSVAMTCSHCGHELRRPSLSVEAATAIARQRNRPVSSQDLVLGLTMLGGGVVMAIGGGIMALFLAIMQALDGGGASPLATLFGVVAFCGPVVSVVGLGYTMAATWR